MKWLINLKRERERYYKIANTLHNTRIIHAVICMYFFEYHKEMNTPFDRNLSLQDQLPSVSCLRLIAESQLWMQFPVKSVILNWNIEIITLSTLTAWMTRVESFRSVDRGTPQLCSARSKSFQDAPRAFLFDSTAATVHSRRPLSVGRPRSLDSSH